MTDRKWETQDPRDLEDDAPVYKFMVNIRVDRFEATFDAACRYGWRPINPRKPLTMTVRREAVSWYLQRKLKELGIT
jgi:hypothetical protein